MTIKINTRDISDLPDELTFMAVSDLSIENAAKYHEIKYELIKFNHFETELVSAIKTSDYSKLNDPNLPDFVRLAELEYVRSQLTYLSVKLLEVTLMDNSEKLTNLNSNDSSKILSRYQSD